MHHLGDIFPIHVDRWDLELAILLRQRFYVELSLLGSQGHGQTKLSLVLSVVQDSGGRQPLFDGVENFWDSIADRDCANLA